MKIREVVILKGAVDDLDEGTAFYNAQEWGVGNYFEDSIIAEIESLVLYAGIHSRKFGLYRMLAKRFPYAIYYDVQGELAFVLAILPVRRDPLWVEETLRGR